MEEDVMERTISKAEINEKPLLQYEGPLSVIQCDEKLDEVLPDIRKETLLGFDTETRPAFRKGESYLPSLLQLGGEHHVWLFYLSALSDLGPLFSILADPAITKAGVAIDRDVLELKELKDFTAAGFTDIGKMAEERFFRKTGLRPLAAMLLNGRVSKGAQVSNWANIPLSEKQITYAATDAWVSRSLYLALQDIRP
jgi:ribonuclease D